MKLAIVIPAYNEEKKFPNTIGKFISYAEILRNKGISTEIIVVNDGSTDKTEEIISRYKNEITIVSYATNKGKGFALKTGVAKADADWIYIADADLSTPIEEIEKFLAKKDDYDCIIGSRAREGSEVNVTFVRKFLGRFGNALVRIILGLKFKDTQCGFKLFNSKAKKYFLLCKNNRWGYDFEFLYLLNRNNLKVYELPVTWNAAGDSKVKPLQYFYTLYELFKIRFNKY